MSALYQIAQNDAPKLEKRPTTSELFYQFVTLVLSKEPSNRPFAVDCLKHDFISPFGGERSQILLANLIFSTKQAVKGLDETRLRKGRQIIENLERASSSSSSGIGHRKQGSIDSTGTSNSTNSSIESKSLDSKFSNNELNTKMARADLNGVTAANSEKDVNNSSNLHNSTIKSSDSVESVREVLTINRQAQLSKKYNDENHKTNNSYQNGYSQNGPTTNTHYQLQQNNSNIVSQQLQYQNSQKSSSQNNTNNFVYPNPNTTSNSNSTHNNHHLQITSISPQLNQNYLTSDQFIEIEKSRKRFATLRSHETLAKIQREVTRPNEILEQLNGYKRLRQQQRKELETLDNAKTHELLKLTEKNNRELDGLRNNNRIEYERHVKKMNSDLEKFLRQQEADDKKLTKQLKELQEQKLKEYKESQRKLYKNEKRNLENLSRTQIGRSQRDSWLKQKVIALKEEYEFKEKSFSDQNKMTFALERRKSRRRCCLQKHSLEREKIKEDCRWYQLENEHELLLKHHQTISELRHKQFEERENLRKKQISTQHETERQNQEQYMRQCKDQLRRKHVKENAAQPRQIKEKERILKQTYRSRVAELEERFLEYKNHIRKMTGIGSKEKKEVIKRQKEEHDRGLSLLMNQYQENVEQMQALEKFELNNSQKDELKLTNDKLNGEMEQLYAYQSQVKMYSDKQKQQDYEALQQDLSMNLIKIEQGMTETRQKLQLEIEEKLARLKEQHNLEVNDFDEQSKQMGFATVFHNRERSNVSDSTVRG